MKVSELIKLLEEMKEKYGDIPVYYFDDGYGWQPIYDITYEDYSMKVAGEFIGLN